MDVRLKNRGCHINSLALPPTIAGTEVVAVLYNTWGNRICENEAH